MIRLAVISGKGGTGKTMVTAGLADIIGSSLSLADCDVEASNLSLLHPGEVVLTEDFYGLDLAAIDPDKCIQCGECLEKCRFDSIEEIKGVYSVRPYHCEGCGVCVYVCPADAISMESNKSGKIFTSVTEKGPLVHARLNPGSSNSGLLVNEVKKRAAKNGIGKDILLIDGPPGIGCPLISTVGGMNAVLAVTEPSNSGLSDLSRVVNVCRSFDLKIFVLVNRFDLEESVFRKIEKYCESEGLKLIGKIPFDPHVIEAVRNNRPVTGTDCPASDALRGLWKTLSKEIEADG